MSEVNINWKKKNNDLKFEHFIKENTVEKKYLISRNLKKKYYCKFTNK